jgi:hypothetical protein
MQMVLEGARTAQLSVGSLPEAAELLAASLSPANERG